MQLLDQPKHDYNKFVSIFWTRYQIQKWRKAVSNKKKKNTVIALRKLFGVPVNIEIHQTDNMHSSFQNLNDNKYNTLIGNIYTLIL